MANNANPKSTVTEEELSGFETYVPPNLDDLDKPVNQQQQQPTQQQPQQQPNQQAPQQQQSNGQQPNQQQQQQPQAFDTSHLNQEELKVYNNMSPQEKSQYQQQYLAYVEHQRMLQNNTAKKDLIIKGVSDTFRIGVSNSIKSTFSMNKEVSSKLALMDSRIRKMFFLTAMIISGVITVIALLLNIFTYSGNSLFWACVITYFVMLVQYIVESKAPDSKGSTAVTDIPKKVKTKADKQKKSTANGGMLTPEERQARHEKYTASQKESITAPIRKPKTTPVDDVTELYVTMDEYNKPLTTSVDKPLTEPVDKPLSTTEEVKVELRKEPTQPIQPTQPTTSLEKKSLPDFNMPDFNMAEPKDFQMEQQAPVRKTFDDEVAITVDSPMQMHTPLEQTEVKRELPKAKKEPDFNLKEETFQPSQMETLQPIQQGNPTLTAHKEVEENKPKPLVKAKPKPLIKPKETNQSEAKLSDVQEMKLREAMESGLMSEEQANEYRKQLLMQNNETPQPIAKNEVKSFNNYGDF